MSYFHSAPAFLIGAEDIDDIGQIVTAIDKAGQ
jgi:hypothetical protein